ncbi:MAG: hypothetical protein GF344_12370 [Chitinivibrionales bacterium]|nr:hypothetical protein [Chitinivibrionales bacterium]MBD3357558.1 hypothetical protein [Chitinivibrionales bacterium]
MWNGSNNARISRVGVLSAVLIVGLLYSRGGAEDNTGFHVPRLAQSKNEDKNKNSQDQDLVGDIEPDETEEIARRKEALHLVTFGFGPGSFVGLDTDPISYNFYGGYKWEPTAHGAVNVIGDVTTDWGSAVMAMMNIGGDFYPLKTSVSPFIGGDAGLGFVRAEDENAAGFTLSGSVGVVFFRTSNVHLDIVIRNTLHVKEIGGENPYVLVGRVGLAI